MASNSRASFTTPVGRLVMGSLYKPKTTDAENKPLVYKAGANAGKPRVEYFIALAVPKGTEKHWSETSWGSTIWRAGHTLWPQAANSPAFAWKVEDGDSVIPNKRDRKPVDNEGWAGNWVLKFTGGFAPKIYKSEGSGYVQLTEPDYIKSGYYIQINANIDSNNSQSNPGIFLNHQMIAFSGFGDLISFGPDVNDAGFGQSPLPAGAMLTPPPSAFPMPVSTPPAPTLAVPVIPNPQFLQVPATPGASMPAAPAQAPIVPVPASPSSQPQMTAKAGGASYQSFISAGWTPEAMIAQGFLIQ